MDTLTIQTYLEVHPEVFWMALGCIFLLLEVTAIPGIGMFFAALAAFTLGALQLFELVSRESAMLMQVAIFFGLTSLWAAILWKPFKRLKNSGEHYHNMVGTSCTATEMLTKGKRGQVKWSGTVMQAKIVEDSREDTIEKDSELWVHEVDGATLYVDVVKPNLNTNNEDDV